MGSVLSGFEDRVVLRGYWELEGALFRVLYRASFCDPSVSKALAAIVDVKSAVATDEERIHAPPSLASERLAWSHRLAVNAYESIRRKPVADAHQLHAELIRQESLLENPFSKAISDRRVEQELHLYAHYNRPFDYLKSMVFNIMATEFALIADLIDERLFSLTSALLAKASDDYAVNHVESFWARAVWNRGRVDWKCARPSELFDLMLQGAFIHRLGRPPMKALRIWGPIGGAHLELVSEIDPSADRLTINEARALD